MKTVKISFIIFLLLNIFHQRLAAQDTLFKKNKETVLCKVVEISPTEIKYKAWNNLDGPNFVIYSDDVYKIRFQNGSEQIIKPDPLTLNQEAQIIDKKQNVKIGFFSPLNNSICVGYERVLKLGTNIEGKVAAIGTGYHSMIANSHDVSGTYSKIGAKFLLGQDFYIKGMKYIHPLKGRYIKIELAYSYFRVKDIELHIYNNQTPYTPTIIKTDALVNAGALNVIYGRQFILGNMFTLDYFIGFGYGGANLKYTNNDANNINSMYKYNVDDITNYYGFSYFSDNFPLTFTAGMSLGYIF
ncbi:MAG: hypothetical protein HY958_01145 [Bacteroidia bacterium]|nr:hypothetical protein [Bacteroidia bacterium]